MQHVCLITGYNWRQGCAIWRYRLNRRNKKSIVSYYALSFISWCLKIHCLWQGFSNLSWRTPSPAHFVCLPYQTHPIHVLHSLLMSWWVESCVIYETYKMCRARGPPGQGWEPLVYGHTFSSFRWLWSLHVTTGREGETEPSGERPAIFFILFYSTNHLHKPLWMNGKPITIFILSCIFHTKYSSNLLTCILTYNHLWTYGYTIIIKLYLKYYLCTMHIS